LPEREIKREKKRATLLTNNLPHLRPKQLPNNNNNNNNKQGLRYKKTVGPKKVVRRKKVKFQADDNVKGKILVQREFLLLCRR